MSTDLTIEQAASILATAFAPLRCVATLYDGGSKLRFNIFDAAEKSLRAFKLLRRQAANSQRLGFCIVEARNLLEDDGFALTPWSFPSTELVQ